MQKNEAFPDIALIVGVFFIAIVIFAVPALSSTVSVVWSNPIKINDNDFDSSEYLYDASMTVDSSGRIYVIWSDQRNKDAGDSQDIYFATSDDGGITFSENKRLVTGSNNTSQGQSQIGIGTGDVVFICYQEEGNIYLTSSADGGDSFTLPVMINVREDALNRDPDMIIDENGVIHVIWREIADRYRLPTRYFQTTDIYYSKSTNGGVTFAPPVKVDDDIEVEYYLRPPLVFQPVLAVGEDGTIYVVWEDGRNIDDNMDWDIYMSRSMDGGQTFSRDKRVNTDNTEGMQYSPAAIVANGLLFIAWNGDVPYEGRSGGLMYVTSDDRGDTFSEEIAVWGCVGDMAFSANSEFVILATGSRGVVLFSKEGTVVASDHRASSSSYLIDGIFLDDNNTVYHSADDRYNIFFSRGNITSITEDNNTHNQIPNNNIDNTGTLILLGGIIILAFIALVVWRKK